MTTYSKILRKFLQVRQYSILWKLWTVSLLMGFVIGTANVVKAAPVFHTTSQGDCLTGQPRGASWLDWQGFNAWDEGRTWGSLWRWNGGNWEQAAAGFNSQRGANGNALVDNVIAPQRGTFQETGAHTATFFAGQRNSFGNQFVCG